MRPEILEAARAHIMRQPGAVAGFGGHRQTYFVALLAVHHWNLAPDDALALMLEWNRTCDPPWSLDEIKRKIREAQKANRTAAPVGCMAEKVEVKAAGRTGAIARWRERKESRTLRTPLFNPHTHTCVCARASRKSYRDLPSEASVRSAQLAAKAGEQSKVASLTFGPTSNPFTEGRRYREAAAVDLYHEDPAGPWLRRHGVLILIQP